MKGLSKSTLLCLLFVVKVVVGCATGSGKTVDSSGYNQNELPYCQLASTGEPCHLTASLESFEECPKGEVTSVLFQTRSEHAPKVDDYIQVLECAPKLRAVSFRVYSKGVLSQLSPDILQQIQYIRIDVDDLSESDTHAFAKMSRLQALSVSGENRIGLSKIYFPHLTNLRAQGTVVQAFSAEAVPALRRLVVRDCDFSQVTTAFSDSKHLANLVLGGCRSQDGSSPEDIRKFFQNITGLTISDTSLSRAEWVAIGDHAGNLKSFIVSTPFIEPGDPRGRSIVDGVLTALSGRQVSRNLEILKIRIGELRDSDVELLAGLDLPDLCSLTLSGDSLSMNLIAIIGYSSLGQRVEHFSCYGKLTGHLDKKALKSWSALSEIELLLDAETNQSVRELYIMVQARQQEASCAK